MGLVRNMLLKESSSARTYRLLDEVASPETPDHTTVLVVLIDAQAKKAVPFLSSKHKTLERVADGELVVASEERELLNLDNLSAAEHATLERRWALLTSVLAHGRQLYDPKFRGTLAQRLADQKVASKPFFYATLQLYWQRGGGKASLVTSFHKCGRPGEPRIAHEGARKAGRPRTIQPGIGVAATEFHRANMRVAWSRAPVGTDGRGLRTAYEWMLIAKYDQHVVFKAGNAKRAAVANYDAVPTFEQFEYHWKQEISFATRKLNRLQARRFELAFKPLLTGTLQEVRGPGTRYYIDATVMDVYCVSRLNPNRIVGRPTLYVVVDQFSRMVVGIYVGLEPPCWAGAMLALWNCCLDKVAYCQEYGVAIKPKEWPTGHIPVHLMGDRGELSSAQADALSAGFNLDVENARPYAGDAKGVVERVFGTLQTKFGPFMPGYVDKEFAGRDAEPAALRGAMDIYEITRVIILATLHANHRVVRDYEGWPEVVADGVPFVPVELWQWGVRNLRCDARQYTSDHLARYLWPQATLKLNLKALKFYRGLYYMGVALQSQSWFTQAFANKQSFTAVYNPMDITAAKVFSPAGRTGCYDVQLTRRSIRFDRMALSEVTALEYASKRSNAAAAWDNLPAQSDWLEQIVETTTEARRRSKVRADTSLSKAERLRGIRGNRAEEIDLMSAEALKSVLGHAPAERSVTVENSVVSDEDRTQDTVRALIAAQALSRTRN